MFSLEDHNDTRMTIQQFSNARMTDKRRQCLSEVEKRRVARSLLEEVRRFWPCSQITDNVGTPEN